MSNTATIQHTSTDAEIDLGVGQQIGDEILLAAIAETEIATVKAGFRGQSRAWSFGGNVD